MKTKPLLILFSLLTAAPASAADADWKIGLAAVRITPEQPVRLSGYASRDEPSKGIAHDLYAKALAVEDAGGHRALLITSDLIGFRADFAEPTCRRITEKTGLKRAQILLNASHTHTGPTLGLDKDALQDNGFIPEHAAATAAYTRALQDKLVQLAADALGRLEPAKLSRGVGMAPFVMNRREFTERGVILGFNPRGHADRSVPVLRIDSPDGELRGVLFGAACHNTTLTGRHYDISGDFAGYAQTHVERARPGVQAMFIQGCAGDANPFPRGSEEIARIHGETLGKEVLRVLETDLQPVAGELATVHGAADLPLQPPPSREQIDELEKGRGGWRGFVARKMREALDAGEQLPTSYPAPVAVWQFGDDLTLVALSGEVVVDYVAMLEKALGPRRLWIAAYCNDVYGYLPSAKVLEEGGYETRGLYAGGIGLFAPTAEKTLVTTVKKLAREAGRETE